MMSLCKMIYKQKQLFYVMNLDNLQTKLVDSDGPNNILKNHWWKYINFYFKSDLHFRRHIETEDITIVLASTKEIY